MGVVLRLPAGCQWASGAYCHCCCCCCCSWGGEEVAPPQAPRPPQLRSRSPRSRSCRSLVMAPGRAMHACLQRRERQRPSLLLLLLPHIIRLVALVLGRGLCLDADTLAARNCQGCCCVSGGRRCRCCC